MYLEYWGLKRLPFENVPDPKFFYLSRSHEEALTRLIYAGKMRKGSAMLSGEIGCGKTTLAKVFVQELSKNGTDFALTIRNLSLLSLYRRCYINSALSRFRIRKSNDFKNWMKKWSKTWRRSKKHFSLLMRRSCSPHRLWKKSGFYSISNWMIVFS